MRGSGHPQLEVRRTMIPLDARWSFNKAPRRFNLVCALSISRYNAGNEPSPRDRRGQASSLLLVVHVSDNVGDVLVAFLLLLDEGGVVQARFLERHEFGIGDFWRHDFFFSCGLDCARRGGGIGARACARRGKLQDGMAFRANDRVLVEIVKSRAATAAEALSTELEFHHGPVPLAVENGAFHLAI